MIEKAKHDQAQDVLNAICIGRAIFGIHFYGMPILILDSLPGSPASFPIEANIYLSIETRWQHYTVPPVHWPSTAGELPDRPIEALALFAVRLRGIPIKTVHLERQSPHLVLIFANGHSLFINGHSSEFECWDLSAGDFQLVAIPGDSIAVWLPDHFPISGK